MHTQLKSVYNWNGDLFSLFFTGPLEDVTLLTTHPVKYKIILGWFVLWFLFFKPLQERNKLVFIHISSI